MRTLTGMLALILLAGDVTAQGTANPESMFRPCADVLSKAELEPLWGTIPDEAPRSAGCLRLTKNEIVVFRRRSREASFHYCDLRRIPACERDMFLPYFFEVEREFSGTNGKRFLLWKTSSLHQGIHDHGYGIFSLAPRSVEERGFVIYALAEGALFRGEDSLAPDPCESLGDEVNEITGYELSGEGTRDVELRFPERIVNCKTKVETLRLNRYRVRSGKFELVP